MARWALLFVLFSLSDGGTLDYEEELGTEVKVHTRTSLSENAETTGTVHITFYGERTVSDAMVLGTGFSGDVKTTLYVDDDLGPLRKIRLSTDSQDGWLVSSIHVEIANTAYTFENAELFWLDKPDETSGLASRYESTAPSGGPQNVREMLEFRVAVAAQTARNYPPW